MKKMLILPITIVIIAAGPAFSPAKKTARPSVYKAGQPTAFQPVAVIELFTSQGCSSCPRADRLLAKTIAAAATDGKNIFALSFHVDYWNRLGWADPFSRKEYSERQSEYASELHLNSVYTPQMIVNGAKEFVGSDEADLKDALDKSLAAIPSAAFKTIHAVMKMNVPEVKFTLEGNYKNCKLNFALVSLSETTAIKRGENGGLTLTNENVVRQLISIPAVAEGEISFKNDPLPKENNIAIVAFIQESNHLKIIGAAKAEIK